MEEKDKPKSKALRIVGLLFVIFVFIYLAINIFSWPIHRPETFCSWAEADANNIAAAITEYFSVPEHRGSIPGPIDIEKLVSIKNPWKLTTCGDDLYIHVIDRSGKCPVEFQNQYQEWNSNIYTLKF